MMRKAMSLSRLFVGSALMIAAGSCASVPKPAPVAMPKPQPVIVPALPPTPPPVTAGAWDEIPEVVGNWNYDRARRTARFVDASGLERASLTCTSPGSAVQLMLFGERAATASVMTSAGANQLSLTGGAVNIAVDDAVLDRIAFSRGRFGLRASALLVLPVQSEIGRVIEDCRG